MSSTTLCDTLRIDKLLWIFDMHFLGFFLDWGVRLLKQAEFCATTNKILFTFCSHSALRLLEMVIINSLFDYIQVFANLWILWNVWTSTHLTLTVHWKSLTVQSWILLRVCCTPIYFWAVYHFTLRHTVAFFYCLFTSLIYLGRYFYSS